MPDDEVDRGARAYARKGEFSQRSSLFEGVRGHGLEMEQMRAEVLSEQRGRVALVSRDATLNRLLLSSIRAQPLAEEQRGIVQHEGVFVLLNLNAMAASSDTEGYGAEEAAETIDVTLESSHTGYILRDDNHAHRAVLDELADVDCILYVWRFSDDWQAIDAQWVARLRATAVPTAMVALCPPAVDDKATEEFRRIHGFRPILVAACEPDIETSSLAADLLYLLDRLLALCPRLAIALAQESPVWRPAIVRRIVRTGALMTGLLGAEPLPLLDLPLQLAMQWKVALQISAIYGRPGLDYRSREMVGALSFNLLVRAVAQQLFKLMPMVGWLLSAALSASSTWLLGTTLARYYEEERIIDLSKLDIRRIAYRRPHFFTSQWFAVSDRIRQRLHSIRKRRQTNNHPEGSVTSMSTDTRETPIADDSQTSGV